jgi:hypothetical protein
MDDALATVARSTGWSLRPLDTLREVARTGVIRAAVDGREDPVVVKVYGPDFAGQWAREAAALHVLRGRSLPVPELLAEGPRFVVMADLGSGASLADALLGDDPAEATRLIGAWEVALGRVHGAGAEADFATALATRTPGSSTVDYMASYLAKAAEDLAAMLPELGVRPEAAALDELRAADGELSPGGRALTPADACPDNNIGQPGGLTLLDFEHATVRHVAWDRAYLSIPWPSCWCAWALPAELTRPALADRDLDLATTAWAFLSTSYFLRRALDGVTDHWAAGEGAVGPTRRQVIRHRLGLARASDALPALAALAEELFDATGRAWGDLDLPLAPAYR